MEKQITVDGLMTRYLEEGEGPAVICLHGASLGSNGDVFKGNIPALVNAGFRVIAYDQPGYGQTDNPKDYRLPYRRDFILKLMDALGINKAHFVAHSQGGSLAAQIALSHPDRVGKVVAAAAVGLLPPIPGQPEPSSEVDPPSLENARKRLESDIFKKSVITDEMVEKRYRASTGKNFEAAKERVKAAQGGGGGKEETPLWKRFSRSSVPQLHICGKDDRGGSVGERCAVFKEAVPNVNLHVINQCSHLIMIDAQEEFNRKAVEFLKG